MVKVKVLPISENWCIIKINNLVYALNKKGYYISLDREIWVPMFLKDAVKRLIKSAKQYGLIDYTPRIYTIPFQQIPYKKQQVEFQLFYHYGDSRGRQVFEMVMSMIKNGQ